MKISITLLLLILGLVSFGQSDSVSFDSLKKLHTLSKSNQIKPGTYITTSQGRIRVDGSAQKDVSGSSNYDPMSASEHLVKYGKLNQIASGLEVTGMVIGIIGSSTLNVPVLVISGIVYASAWIVRTVSYKHVIRAGELIH